MGARGRKFPDISSVEIEGSQRYETDPYVCTCPRCNVRASTLSNSFTYKWALALSL